VKNNIYKEAFHFLKQLLLYQSIDDVIKDSVDIAVKLLNAERATLFIYDDNRDILYSKIALGLAQNQVIELTLDEGIAGWVAKNKKMVNIRNAYKDHRFFTNADKIFGFKTHNILCMPLISIKDEILGVLQVLNKKKGYFTKKDEDIAEVLAETIASILENFNLHQENELMLKSTIKALSSAIDARDPATRGHSERVSKLAVRIGKELGYPPERLRLLEYSALLHDIGKLGVRDNILLKPGVLTTEEYNIMKSHAEFTRKILEEIHFPKQLKSIPLIASSHHEKLDGSGYPKGLSGQQIPEEAKILAVCDIFDALVSYDRPYKKAMSVEEAKAILDYNKGLQLDPQIVDILFEKQLYLGIIPTFTQRREPVKVG
jgi:putative nucleotidyltransferase with HDIG domain